MRNSDRPARSLHAGAFLASRFGRVALVLLTLQSIAFTRVPLLNTLGLEFGAASAPFAVLLAGLALLRHWRTRGEYPADHPWRSLASGSSYISPLLIPPLVVGVLNVFFVRNCALYEGAFAFLLVLAPALIFGVGLASCSAGVTSSFPRTLYVVAWLAVLGHIAVVTLAGAQIFAFNPILGYFPGFSYDEALAVLPKLALYRVSTIAAAIMLAGIGSVVQNARIGGWRTVVPLPRFRLTFALVLAIGLWWVGSDTMGFSSSLGRIRSVLGGVRETDHFTIFYPRASLTDAQADRLAERHEFLYDRLRKTLRIPPQARITSVLYANADQKQDLVGAGRTDFTKPWLRQMHIGLGSASTTLPHEMTHVLAADFGIPFLAVGANPGVVEGIAVALERESNGENLHRAAAQVAVAGYSLDVSDVFSFSGFFGSNSSVSYTLAGSFCRYLIEQFGLRQFKMFYRSGSLLQAYGHRPQDLQNAWRRRIEAIPLDHADTVKALYYYRRPPVYARECVRVIGNLNAEARRALAGGRDSAAVTLAQDSWKRSRSPESASILVTALVRLGRYEEAVAAADSAMRDERLASSVITLELGKGDALWGMRDVRRAHSSYEHLLESDLSLGWNEALSVRLEALDAIGDDSTMRTIIFGPEPDSIKSASASHLVQSVDEPIVRYAAARLLDSEKDAARVIELLEDMPPLSSTILNYVARRRLATAYLLRGEFERSKAAQWESLNFTSHDVEEWHSAEGIAWAGWLEERTVMGDGGRGMRDDRQP